MLHMMKVAVGIQDIQHLQDVNAIIALENQGYPYTLTRFHPKKIDEILNGGSLYRMIKGVMCCRQKIKDFVPSTRDNGQDCVRIILEPEIIRTASIAIRPFQGWRYLTPKDAPKDLNTQKNTQSLALPIQMKQALLELGLIDF